MSAAEYVYRFNELSSRKGARCRIEKLAAGLRGRVTVAFDDGSTADVPRSAIVLASSKLGRQSIARVARGDMAPSDMCPDRDDR